MIHPLHPVTVVRRSDFARVHSGLSLEEITLDLIPSDIVRSSELILFVGQWGDQGMIKVLKNRSLAAIDKGVEIAVPTNIIIPASLFVDLVSDRLDLASPGIIMPGQPLPRLQPT